MKYEEVYLKAYTDGRQAKTCLDNYFRFYNTQRPHKALGYRNPAEVFHGATVQSTEHLAGKRWSSTGALADPGKMAGLSLNIAYTLSN